MMLWLILACGGLLGILLQDFKSRAVYWWWFPVVSAGIVGFFKRRYDAYIFPEDVLVNLCISLFVASLTALSYLVRSGTEGIRRLKCSIGTGDLVMVPVLIYTFSPFNFLVFFILSLITALIGHFIWTAGDKPIETIPLAGYWSLLLIVSVLFTWAGYIDIRNDNWIYVWLTN